MKVQVPAHSDTGARVIKFTPRTLSNAPVSQKNGIASPSTEADGFTASIHRRRPLNDPDEFRHRMLTNLAAFVFAAALTAAGIWLTTNIAELRQTQDCVLSGHRNCAPVIPSSGGPA
jgi:hypothetical protein